MDGMFLLKRLLRTKSGQSTTEYMIVVAVVAVGAMAAFGWFANPEGKVQQGGAKLADNFREGLTNETSNSGGGVVMEVK